LAAALIVFSLIRLTAGVADWNASAHISEKIVRDIEREANAAQPGSLLVLDAPPAFEKSSTRSGRAVGRPWILSWALPYAAQQPYANSDLTGRVLFIDTPRTHCYSIEHWARNVASTVRKWMAGQEATPLRILEWDAGTGSLTARTVPPGSAAWTKVRGLAGMSNAPAINDQLGEVLGHALPALN
jgi:hypothetical protein